MTINTEGNLDPSTLPFLTPPGMSESQITGDGQTTAPIAAPQGIKEGNLDRMLTGNEALFLLGTHLGVSFSTGGNVGGMPTFKSYSQEVLDRTDPSSPDLPVLVAFAKIMSAAEGGQSTPQITDKKENLSINTRIKTDDAEVDRANTESGIGNVQADASKQTAGVFNAEAKGQLNKLGATEAKEVLTKETGNVSFDDVVTTLSANPWLAAALMTVIAAVFAEIAKYEANAMKVEQKIEFESQKMVWDNAKNIAEFIIAKGEVEAQQHIINAIANGVSLGITVGTTVMMARSLSAMKVPEYKTMPVTDTKTNITTNQKVNMNPEFDAPNTQNQMKFELWKSLSVMANHASGLITESTSAATATDKAGLDSAIEMMRTVGDTIRSQSFDKAMDAWRQAKENIANLWTQYTQIYQKSMEAKSQLMQQK